PPEPRDRPGLRAAVAFAVYLLAWIVPLATPRTSPGVAPAVSVLSWIGLAIVVAWCAWPLLRGAASGIRQRIATMDLLVAGAVVAAGGCAVVSPDFVGVAAGITAVVLAGRWLRRGAIGWIQSALTRRVPRALAAIDPGTRFEVGTRAVVPADGIVVGGAAEIDVTVLTGRPEVRAVAAGQRVPAGATVLLGELVVAADSRPAYDGYAHAADVMTAPRSLSTAAERLAQRAVAVFVPVVAVAAVATAAVWWGLFGSPMAAVRHAVAVLVVACPCAVGLAIPLAVMVASGAAARLGAYPRGHRAFEDARGVTAVVFDKTGTLTAGAPQVTGVCAAGVPADDVLRLAAAAEAGYTHPVARGIAAAGADGAGIGGVGVDGAGRTTAVRLAALPEGGVTRDVDGTTVKVAAPRTFPTRADELLRRFRRDREAAGETVVFIALGPDLGRPVGAIALADHVESSAASAVAELRAGGVRTVLVTGDNPYAAQHTADTAGITEVLGEAGPEAKVDIVRQLQALGHRVALVGDGMGDEPALRAADLGITFSARPAAVVDASDMALTGADLRAVPRVIALSQRLHRIVVENLAWSLGYNVFAIPLAATGVIGPLPASALMGLSSAVVVANSLRLRVR
ncbi:heavy metal translocating P-type ATPase, partial [Tsukamurella soli]